MVLILLVKTTLFSISIIDFIVDVYFPGITASEVKYGESNNLIYIFAAKLV